MAKKLFEEMLGYAFLGVFFGLIGLVLGYGESHTGRYSGIEPHGCFIVVFGFGIYFWRWMRKSAEVRRVSITLGFVRAIAFLLPISMMSLMATGVTDQTMDPGPAIKIPMATQALEASLVFAFWAAGLVLSAITTGIIATSRGIGRLCKRLTA